MTILKCRRNTSFGVTCIYSAANNTGFHEVFKTSMHRKFNRQFGFLADQRLIRCVEMIRRNTKPCNPCEEDTSCGKVNKGPASLSREVLKLLRSRYYLLSGLWIDLITKNESAESNIPIED